jgi:integrase
VLKIVTYCAEEAPTTQETAMQLNSFLRTHSSIVRQASIVNSWLLPYLGRYQLEHIRAAHVAALLKAVRESGASDSHVRSVLCCLRSVMQDACRAGQAGSDPTQDFHVKVRKAQVTALTIAQRDALDAVLREDLGPISEALRIILWTGLRISEALALRPEDFDPSTYTLTVRSGKSDAAARRVDVPNCVLGTLERYLTGREKPHQTTLRRALRTACAAADVPQVRVHDLRHTRITTQLLAGVPVGYVSKQAGHASSATTLDIYDQWIQVAPQEQRRAWANS